MVSPEAETNDETGHAREGSAPRNQCLSRVPRVPRVPHDGSSGPSTARPLTVFKIIAGCAAADDYTSYWVIASSRRAWATAIITDAIPATGTFEATYDVVVRVLHPADVNLDGTVAVGDLLLAIANWGVCDPCNGDANGDGVIDVEDVLMIVGAWGATEPGA